MFKKIAQLTHKPRTIASNSGKKVLKIADRRPFVTFFIILALLFVLILIGNILTKPAQTTTKKDVTPKQVDVFRIGGAPRIQVQAKIEKSGVVKIVAQTGGVVKLVKVSEGQSVKKGSTLVVFSTNYQGGNAPAVQTALAAKQLELAKTNQDAQKDIIARQRDLANTQGDNTEQLRKINEQSISETQSTINAQQDVLNMVNQQIDYLSKQPGANDPTTTSSPNSNFNALEQARGQRAQLVAGINQANSALRNTQYQTDTTKPPTQIANISKDITLKQLDLQEKVNGLNKDLAQLQLSLAYINEGLMYPAAPAAGVVERVYVKEGQVVTPGTPLLTMTFNQQSTTAVASVTRNVAQSITRLETSIMHIDKFNFETYPTYISGEATDNSLHTVLFEIPDNYQKFVTEGGYIMIDVPIDVRDTNPTDPFIPLDAIYQTQNSAYLFVVKNGHAESREIQLGEVYGRFVGVDKGVNDGDLVILNRNIINNDPVKVNK